MFGGGSGDVAYNPRYDIHIHIRANANARLDFVDDPWYIPKQS